MALSKQTYVERVLIVLSPDGKFVAAHQEFQTRITDGDELISAHADVQPLGEDSLAKVLPDIGSLLAQVGAANGANGALIEKLDAAAKQIDEQKAEIGDLEIRLENASYVD